MKPNRAAAVLPKLCPATSAASVPCDLVALYHALRSIAEAGLACGDSFCEWGSGLGGVASLAAMLGFDAYGIEIDQDLCRAAQELAGDFSVPVEFVNGSFIPNEAEGLVGSGLRGQRWRVVTRHPH